MLQNDIHYASLAELSRLLETRQLSSVELTELYLNRVERVLCQNPIERLYQY